MMKQFRRFLRQDEGAVMVEMAVVMPFIFMLAYGIFEFGNVLYQHHLISTGVRDAARYLSRFPTSAGDLLLDGGPVAARIAVTGQPAVGGVKRVSWWNVGAVTIVSADEIRVGDVSIVTDSSLANPRDSSTGERDYRGGDNITIITVSTTVTHPSLGFLNLLDFGGGSITSLDFTLSHQERYNGR